MKIEIKTMNGAELLELHSLLKGSNVESFKKVARQIETFVSQAVDGTLESQASDRAANEVLENWLIDRLARNASHHLQGIPEVRDDCQIQREVDEQALRMLELANCVAFPSTSEILRESVAEFEEQEKNAFSMLKSSNVLMPGILSKDVTASATLEELANLGIMKEENVECQPAANN